MRVEIEIIYMRQPCLGVLGLWTRHQYGKVAQALGMAAKKKVLDFFSKHHRNVVKLILSTI